MAGGLLDRRSLLRLALGGAAGAALGGAGCGGDYGPEDEAALERQRREEAEQAGRGPLGPLRFRGYRGLAALPELDLDGAGRVVLAPGVAPSRGIDLHTHLGMHGGLAPAPDLLQRTERIRYLLDCDGVEPPCALDLDIYLNGNFTPELRGRMLREFRGQLLWGSKAAATHTVPNLVDELDRMGFAHAAVLPIAWGLPFGPDLTLEWLDAIEAAGARGRLIPFASVHPRDRGWPAKLETYVARGVRGVKLHPEMQRFHPDDPEALEVYAGCAAHGLPVFFHAGRSGIEPRFLRGYAVMRRYRGAVASQPDHPFVFGHGGARDAREAIAIAREHPNVWLGIAGLGASALAEALDAVGPERLTFGSDWPFYPLAATLAKVWRVTEGAPAARDAILRGNAAALLGLEEGDAA